MHYKKGRHEKPIKLFKCFAFNVIGPPNSAEEFARRDWPAKRVSSGVFPRFPSVDSSFPA